MCGIAGAIAVGVDRGEAAIDYTCLELLVRANLTRGNLGHGVFAFAPGVEMIYRRNGAMKPEQLHGLSELPYRIVAVHTRAPTGRQSVSVDCLHPFSTDRLLMAHNGLLINWRDEYHTRARELCGSGRLSEIDVDTTALLAGISNASASLPMSHAIARTAELFDGQQACWLFDRTTRIMYLWRVMAPIYYGVRDGVVYFGSACLDGVTSHLLPQGMVAGIDYKTSPPWITTVQFDFKTPYIINEVTKPPA